MLVPLNKNHLCSLYCLGTRHYTETLALPQNTMADVVRHSQGYFQRYGWQVVAARRAPEADVATRRAWMQRNGSWGCAEDGEIARNVLPEGDLVAWLVWIAPMEQETPAGA